MQLIKEKKILLAVSGGPDSMFLLNKFKNKNIIVAHINYNKREDSYNDESIVRKFCKENKITLKVKQIRESDYENIKGNFQANARKIRYSFFKEVYDRHHCDELLIAHNKDDFLETAILQKKSKRKVAYFGIKKKIKIYGMNIRRPFLFSKWKQEIEEYNSRNDIPFAIDYTNAQDIYSRNKIRNHLSSKNIFHKRLLLVKFRFINFFKNFENLYIQKKYQKWEKESFDIKWLLKNRNSQSKKILFIFLHNEVEELNLSTKKLNSIFEFIKSKDNSKKYLLKENAFLYKRNSMLSIINIGTLNDKLPKKSRK